MRHLLPIFLLSLMLAACSPRTDSEAARIKAVRDFHTAVLAQPQGGAPSAAQIEQLAPLISRAFRDRLLALRTAEDRAFARHEGTEPPLVGGALFYSLAEGAQRLGAISADDGIEGGNAYQVALEYGPPGGKEKSGGAAWRDRAWVLLQDGRFVVDDLSFTAPWQYGPKGRMSKMIDQLLLHEAPILDPRTVQVMSLPGGQTVVIAEGDREARSVGSYSVRLYAANPDQPGDVTFYLDGSLRPRDGTLQRALTAPLLKGKPDMLVVLLRSAGSGGYLSADAFEIAKDRLQWRASVEGLSAAADPLEALRRKLAAQP